MHSVKSSRRELKFRQAGEGQRLSTARGLHMQTLRRSCLRSSTWSLTCSAAGASSSWRYLFSAPREAEAATEPELAQQPDTAAAARYVAEDTAVETLAEGGAPAAHLLAVVCEHGRKTCRRAAERRAN